MADAWRGSWGKSWRLSWTGILRRGCGCAFYGDGRKYADGEVYCNSTFTRRAYLILRDMVCHNSSVRFQATGRFVLDSVRAIINFRRTQPFHYQVNCDQHLVKRLSLRIQARGCMRLDRIIPIIKIRKQQPRV